MKLDHDQIQRVTKTLDLNEVLQYFKSKKFTPVNLEQQWRHITGIVEKNGEKYFLKLATTIAIGERTENEYEWNNIVNSLKVEQKLPVAVPKVYERGFYNGLFWYVGEYIKGDAVARLDNKQSTKVLEENLSLIAEASKAILNLPTNKKLPNDVKKYKANYTGSEYQLYVEKKAAEVGEKAQGLLSFFNQRLKYHQFAPSHGDFIPWHILKNNAGTLYLLDAEHSAIRRTKFYDLVYFYQRVYTNLERPDIADSYLKEFNRIWVYKDDDIECLKLVFAHRLISGYLDAQEDGITSVKLQDDLRQKLISGDIV